MRPPTILRYWLPAVLWMGVIFMASTDAYSATRTAPWISAIVSTIVRHPLSPGELETMNDVLRKAAHLTEYGILGALLFRAVRADEPVRWRMRWGFAAIALAFSVASLDEWHQTFVPSRTGAFSDVLLDTAGATLAQIVIRVAQMLFFSL